MLSYIYAAAAPAGAGAPPTLLIDICLMAMLVVVAFAIVRMRSLFAIVMLQGVYSLLSAAWFVSLDAVDVAFTEAAVGAGISTVLMLSAMLLTDRQSAPVPVKKAIGPIMVCVLAGAAMFYAISDMPAFGDANSPANTGPGMEYMTASVKQVEVPNVVTAVLASYRGYDTMAETVVIFMAGLGVLLLLGLNGNAGFWQAKVQGQNICKLAAPRARVLTAPGEKPNTQPQAPDEMPEAVEPAKPRAVKKVSTKKAPPKKAAPKKAATKKSAPKKTAVKKPRKTAAKPKGDAS